MSVRQIFQQCGLEDYISLAASQVQDTDYIRDRAADWSPTAAFPGRLLREWSSTQHAKHDDLSHTHTDRLSSRLPIEIIEHIFSSLEHQDLYLIAHLNRLLSPLALARLYHDIRLDATRELTRLVQCLDTLSNCPHLASQVCSFELIWKRDPDSELASAEQSLTSALAAVYPYAHAVWLRGAIRTSNLTPSANCAQLRSLRLESMGCIQKAQFKLDHVAPFLVHLEAHIGFVSTILSHLPTLRSLVTVARDFTTLPYDTQLAYNLHHPTLRKLSLEVTWLKTVDPTWIRYLMENSKPLGELPSVEHLTILMSVPPWGSLANLLFNFFLPKIPSVKAIILESTQDQALDMAGITKQCSHLVDIALQNEAKEWIKDQSLGRWQLFDRNALLNAIQNSQTMTTLQQLRESFAACVERTVYTRDHVEAN